MSETPSLRPEQFADLVFYNRNPRCMNLSEPATGKTPSVAVYLYQRAVKENKPMAWAMPLSLMKKNKDEIVRFTGMDPDDIAIVDGTRGQIDKIMAKPKPIYLCGFTRFGREWRMFRDSGRIKGLAVDEIHMGFSTHTSQRTQGMTRAMRDLDYFLAMTGTLVSGRLDTAYPSINVIEPRYYNSFQNFLNYHGVLDEDGKVMAWQNHAKLAEIFRRHGIRRTFEMVYGPEAKVIQTEQVEMSPRQREIYDEFEETAVLELERFFVDGTLPGVATIRARQIMEHPNHFPDLMEPGKYVDILKGQPSGKLERIDIHLEDHVRTGKPLVIFSVLIPQQRQIAELARSKGLRVAIMNGTDNTAKMNGQIDEDFRKGLYDVLVVTPAVASVGFNWQYWKDQEVEHVIFASIDYLDTNFYQAYRRFIRGKRKTPLLITVLEYIDSLDQRVFGILKQKSTDANAVDPTRQILNLFGGREDAA